MNMKKQLKFFKKSLSYDYLETRARSKWYITQRSLKLDALRHFGWESLTSMLATWVDGWSMSSIVGAKVLNPNLRSLGLSPRN